MKAGARDHATSAKPTGRRDQDSLAWRVSDRRDACARNDRPASRAQLIRIGERDPAKINNPRSRRPQSSNAGNVRLDLPDPLRSDNLEAVDAIGCAPLLERHQTRDLRLVEGNNQLSAMAVGNAVVVGKAFELELPFPTKPRLEGSRGVVESRVQHARVVAGLMDAEVGFLLNDCHAQGRL